MTGQPRKLLVTYALPYANGPLHLGHMTGLIQTDIWVRFQKMQALNCVFVCGCDSHGTPIMIQAEKSAVDPATLTENIRALHQADLNEFSIDVDNYYTTHSPENRELSEQIFRLHDAKGNIIKKTIQQAYDPEKNMFLPDRLIRGECPRCGTHDQYGDNCEACGATYSPTELKNPRSTLSGATPIEKSSEHYFFRLTHYEKFLREWTRAGHLQEEVTHKLDEWFAAGLKDWDISRDAPYFGFTIPGETNKYFYCWLDAPVGYIASFSHFCARHPEFELADYWDKNSSAELYHFIGKDIIYFHALFWPAILEGADFRTPTAIFTHGFLTINGQKMSKSRGTFILAKTFAEYFPSDFLRYYLATRLSQHVEDLDLQFDDFMQRVNSDLVGKFVNIASRCARILQKNFNNQLAATLSAPDLFHLFATTGTDIAKKMDALKIAEAMRDIMALADRANQYIDTEKPWALMKTNDQEQIHFAQTVCTTGINLFRQLMIYLKPVLPKMAAQAENFLQCGALLWSDSHKPLLNHQISDYPMLAKRIEKNEIEALLNAITPKT